MSEQLSRARVIDLSERRKRRTAADFDAARHTALPARRARPARYILELAATRPLYEKLMLAKLLLSDEGSEATLTDVVEVALEIWLGDCGRPPYR